MVVDSNKEFDKVYDKLINTIDRKAKQILLLREVGMPININSVKLLNLYIKYLDSVKESKYTYFTVAGLTNISNYLNKL